MCRYITWRLTTPDFSAEHSLWTFCTSVKLFKSQAPLIPVLSSSQLWCTCFSPREIRQLVCIDNDLLIVQGQDPNRKYEIHPRVRALAGLKLESREPICLVLRDVRWRWCTFRAYRRVWLVNSLRPNVDMIAIVGLQRVTRVQPHEL